MRSPNRDNTPLRYQSAYFASMQEAERLQHTIHSITACYQAENRYAHSRLHWFNGVRYTSNPALRT